MNEKPMEPLAMDDADGAVEGGAQSARLLRLRDWETRFPWLSAGISTREGGVSGAPYGSLNCGLHVGDDGHRVADNRRRVAEGAGLDIRRWTCAEQVHGNAVHIATAADAGKGSLSMADAIPGADALATDVPGVMLAAVFADCVPVWIVDSRRRVVAICHAGWRGTVQGAAVRTVRAMADAFGSDPSDLHAAVGPSIRACCYEVDDFVARHIPASAESALEPTSPGRYKLDLAKINRQQLTEAGIMANRIEISQYCTGCRTDLFFSHRMENGRTGRMTAWIARKE